MVKIPLERKGLPVQSRSSGSCPERDMGRAARFDRDGWESFAFPRLLV